MKSLIKILEQSVKIHGANTPLSIGHLLNIAKMCEQMEGDSQDTTTIEQQYFEETTKYGS